MADLEHIVLTPVHHNLAFKSTKRRVAILPPVPDATVSVGEIQTELGDIPVGDTPPDNPSVGDLWIDTQENLA